MSIPADSRSYLLEQPLKSTVTQNSNSRSEYRFTFTKFEQNRQYFSDYKIDFAKLGFPTGPKRVSETELGLTPELTMMLSVLLRRTTRSVDLQVRPELEKLATTISDLQTEELEKMSETVHKPSIYGI